MSALRAVVLLCCPDSEVHGYTYMYSLPDVMAGTFNGGVVA